MKVRVEGWWGDWGGLSWWMDGGFERRRVRGMKVVGLEGRNGGGEGWMVLRVEGLDG